MPSKNICFIAGHLGQDPEVKVMNNGRSVARSSIGVTDKWVDKTTGEEIKKTEWVPIKAFGYQADILGCMSKGDGLQVEGAFRTEQYEKGGVKKYFTYIEARDVMPWRKVEFRSQADKQETTATQDFNDDIPF